MPLNCEENSSVRNFIRYYLYNKFIPYTENEKQIRWDLNINFKFVKNMFFNENGKRYICKKYLNLPTSKIFHILDSYNNNFFSYNNEVSVNPDLVLYIQYLLCRYGMNFNFDKNRNTFNVLQKNSPIVENYCFSEILDVELVRDYKEKTFIDLEVDTTIESEKNYFTPIGLVHNGGKRKGVGTMFLSMWHRDIKDFILARDPETPEHLRAQDLFYCVWVHDLFMERVIKNKKWTLFCPNKVKGLTEVYGKDFEQLYKFYEKKYKKYIGRESFVKEVSARELYIDLIKTQIKTGMPFVCYADMVNRKNNQINMGTICCSNLCLEINQYCDDNNIASCNLASLSLPSFVKKDKNNKKHFDFVEFESYVRKVVNNIERVIDRTYYPDDIPQIKNCNLLTRPQGLGISGLVDVFMKLDLTWEMEETRLLNRDIAETMYYAAITESINLAKKFGPYSLFNGSPISQGKLQFHLWDEERKMRREKYKNCSEELSEFFKIPDFIPITNKRYDWDLVSEMCKTFGVRHSEMIAPMPTASTAHILGNNECFEPYTTLVGTRRLLNGEFIIVNKYLMKDLIEICLWNTKVLNFLIENKCRLSGFTEFVKNNLLSNEEFEKLKNRLEFLENKYKTAYELDGELMVKFVADRGEFVCQSQSFNYFRENPTISMLIKYHIVTWLYGLKTGMYYLRQPAKYDPVNFCRDIVSVVIPPVKKQKVINYVCDDMTCCAL